MSRTPARKRGEDGRLLPLEEAQPDRQDGLDSQEEGDGWEAGEGFNGLSAYGCHLCSTTTSSETPRTGAPP